MTNSSVRALTTSSATHARKMSLRAARALSRMMAIKLGARGLFSGAAFTTRADFVSLRFNNFAEC
eukprot:10227869-Lingulodinium_polyedra.AAC.1